MKKNKEKNTMAWTRRDFIKTGVGATLGFTTMPLIIGKEVKNRPNLLVIHTDQLSSWALSLYAPALKSTPNYGKILVKTPHIDGLGRDGAKLENFFTNSAVCTPSRGCLWTGRYPHCHGAYRNDLELDRDEITLAILLKQNGYETGYSGKWHLDGKDKPGFMTKERSMGFDDCRYMFNRGHWKEILETPEGDPKVSEYGVLGDSKTYTTDYLADRTIEFINRPRKRPFFYAVSFPDPHTPFTVREPFMDMYGPEEMVVPHTFKDPGNETEDKKKKGKKKKKRPRTRETLKKLKAQYCGLVQCIDFNVGRIISALKKKGIYDHTIVLFTTDHGEYMGEHNLWGKNQWYRTAYQVPLLIRWPEKIPQNLVIHQFVTMVDVQQTLLSLMGLKPSGREQGRDASPLLRGEKVKWEDVAWIHHSTLSGAGIFTPTYELVLREKQGSMLFNREKDPEQVKNLADDPAHKKAFQALSQRVVAHHRKLNSPATKWLTRFE